MVGVGVGQEVAVAVGGRVGSDRRQATGDRRQSGGRVVGVAAGVAVGRMVGVGVGRSVACRLSPVACGTGTSTSCSPTSLLAMRWSTFAPAGTACSPLLGTRRPCI